MVVQRRHAENARLPVALKTDLVDVGEDDGDEQAADNDGEQLRRVRIDGAGDGSSEARAPVSP